MRIVIAGPIPNSKASGGVAVFDKNLATTLAEQGHQVLLLTRSYDNKQKANYEKKNIQLVKLKNFRMVYRFNADIIISSLWYSAFFCFKKYQGKKIHLLHGFTTFKYYSVVKVNVMHLLDKYIRKNFQYILANSTFTQFINEEIYNLMVDGIYTIGIDESLIKQIEDNNDKRSRTKNILFVGRIVSAKNLEQALRAVVKVNPDLYESFDIYGYGEEEDKLKKQYKTCHKIKFKGQIAHNNIYNIYKKSKVFISLNPSEPFGITYEEALASGLYIIAPNTGGQVNFLKQFPERCSLVEVSNIDSIIEGLVKGLNSQLAPLTKDELEKLSYKNTAKQILTVTKK